MKILKTNLDLIWLTFKDRRIFVSETKMNIVNWILELFPSF